MLIGIPKEPLAGETRVAATPKTVELLKKLGFDVCIESTAGLAANFDDAAYEAAGAFINANTKEVYQSDLVLKVNPLIDHPGQKCHELELLKEGGHLISFMAPAQNEDQLKQLAERNITALAMESCHAYPAHSRWMH